MGRVVGFLIAAAIGAFGYHVYLTQNPKAGAQYVISAYQQARQDSDRLAVSVYIRQVATVIEAARIDNPKTTLPRDCTRGYSLGSATRATTLTRCTVTVDAADSYKVEARSVAGSEATLGHY